MKKDIIELIIFMLIACFLTSMCLTTFIFWEFVTFTSCVIGLTIIFTLAFSAIMVWGFVCAFMD